MTRSIAAALCLALATAALARPALAQVPADKPLLAPASGNPNLSVATVKLDGGVRLSKIIGGAVVNEQKEELGSVNDLIMLGDNKVVMAIIGVGGIAGFGSKLVAVPFTQLTAGPDGKMLLKGATKDSLNAMPNFTFG